MSESLQSAAQTGDVAVVICAENIDQRIETTLTFFEVIGDIGGKVSGDSVVTHDDPIFIVAKARGAKPLRSVFDVEQIVLAQAFERSNDGATGIELALRGPAIKVNAVAI